VYKQIAAWSEAYGPALELLLYPSDEFGGQELPEDKVADFCSGKKVPVNEPGSGSHLMAKARCRASSCLAPRVVRKTRRRSPQGKVNGPEADPVWKFAKSVFPGDVTWNFKGMFLFDKAGACVKRYDGHKGGPDDATLRSML